MATKVKLVADGAITPDQITLTTASAGTNTTAPATTAFVQQEITALVDSSPAALNTLNELAAALGDDANFSTTVTNSIATKAPLASPDFTGDATFDTSTLVVDSTNDRIGIGTASPTKNLHVYHATTDRPALVESGDANALLEFKDISTSNAPAVGATGDNLIFQTGSSATERARIDSSGNLLVGTTDTTLYNNSDGSEGIRIASDHVSIAGDQRTLLYLNRQTTDGEIVRLLKDGTTVGSIGAAPANRLFIGSGDTGLRFVGDADEITPWNTSTNSASDNLLDLGNTNNRFKDLQLAGTASIGNLTIAGAQGTDGQLLTSTGSGVAWEDAPASGPSIGKAIVLSMIFG